MRTLLRATTCAVALVAELAIPTYSTARAPAMSGCAAVELPASDHDMPHHATPAAGMRAMDHGTPMTGMAQAEFDLLYIDMMIPHHESIIALANAALPELTDPRLIEMAEAIIDTQGEEIAELERLRAEWYPDADPASMETMIDMPGMEGTEMAEMDRQMSAEWQVQAFREAENKDVAFIDQAIPHHQMAIDVSEAALQYAVHPELRAKAEDVITAQEAEVAELEEILAELTGEASPAA